MTLVVNELCKTSHYFSGDWFLRFSPRPNAAEP